MAKIRGSKEGAMSDPSSNMPSQQKPNESIKKKISKILDVFPFLNKDTIARILEYYNDDEIEASDAITRDGGKEALRHWANDSKNKAQNNKNKKKKRKNKKDLASAVSATASFDADDSSSLHSGGNVDIDLEKESQNTENGPLVNVDEVKKSEEPKPEQIKCDTEPEVREVPKEIPTQKLELRFAEDSNPASPDESSVSSFVASNCDRSHADNSTRTSPSSDISERQDDQAMKREKYRSSSGEGYAKQTSRQRTNSFRRNKTSSISEESSQSNSQASSSIQKRGYEKCKKDLNRQTVSLQRIQTQVEKGFEESERKIKNVFSDLLKKVETRQKELELMLAERKAEAFDLLKTRQDLGAELKRRVDRSPSLSDAEWTELRTNIKQFVTERKYDDELGKTIWFQWEETQDIFSNFGEVPAVKNVYSQRSHAANSSAVKDSNPEPSPSSSVANEEMEPSVEKNDVDNNLDATEDVAAAPKEDIPTYNKHFPNENRNTRIYSSSQYKSSRGVRAPNNRGRFFSGNRGGPQFRANYRNNNNYYPNRQNYDEYRNQPYHNRDGHSDNYPYHGDRNRNQYQGNKMNRGYDRGPHVNMRSNYRPRGGPRHNVVPSEPEAVTNTVENNADKSNVDNAWGKANVETAADKPNIENGWE